MKSFIFLATLLLVAQATFDPTFFLAPSKKHLIQVSLPGMGKPQFTKTSVNGLPLFLYNTTALPYEYKTILNNSRALESTLVSAIERAINKQKAANLLPNVTFSVQNIKISYIDLTAEDLNIWLDFEAVANPKSLYRCRMTIETHPHKNKTLVNDYKTLQVGKIDHIRTDLFPSIKSAVETSFKNDTPVEYETKSIINNAKLVKQVVQKGIEFYNKAKKSAREPKVGKIVKFNQKQIGLDKVTLYVDAVVFHYKLQIINDEGIKKLVSVKFEYEPTKKQVRHYTMESEELIFSIPEMDDFEPWYGKEAPKVPAKPANLATPRPAAQPTPRVAVIVTKA